MNCAYLNLKLKRCYCYALRYILVRRERERARERDRETERQREMERQSERYREKYADKLNINE